MKKKQKLGRKLLSFLLTLALVVGLVPVLGMTAYAETLNSESTTWSENSVIAGDVTINNNVTVNADITLTIPEGKTLTINGQSDYVSYAAIYCDNDSILTVSGGGTLIVNAPAEEDGHPALVGIGGNLIVDGATVQVTGGAQGVYGNVTVKSGLVCVNGGNGEAGSSEGGSSEGGEGYSGISGVVIVNGGSITVVGGNGGNGYNYGNGGDGGYGVGDVIVNGGSATITGGNGGTKGSDAYAYNGNFGQAVYGSITGNAEESEDNTNWTSVTDNTSSKQYIKFEPILVTSVSLNETTTQTIDIDGTVAFTATVAPDGATDKTVKWSTTGGVTLYSDENCTAGNEIGADATSTLTVYAKGTAAGSATVTATSNADSTKSASCNVTVNAGNTTISYASLKNTTTEITFDGKHWYLIDYDDSTVTLLSKECVGASRFGSENTYAGSTVESAVNNYYAESISTGAKTAVSDNKMFLLSTDEADTIHNANPDVLKCSEASDAEENIWWLCSQGYDYYYAAVVDGDTGEFDEDGKNLSSELGVRPALKLDLSKVTFDSTSNTFTVVNSSVAVTGVTLDKTTAQTVTVGDTVSFNATVAPDNASDKTVKWSVGGTNADAVTLYSDEACETAVTLDTATETLTVYAKGISAGNATVTCTSNADSEKSASCNVTVNAYAGNSYASLVNTTTSVEFNDMDWYIIADDSTAVDAGTVTLLSKDPIRALQFHESQNSVYVYSTSLVKDYLDSLTGTDGTFEAVADAIVTVKVRGSNSDSEVDAKLWLLSTSEAEGLSEDVRKCSTAMSYYWWLRSRGLDSSKAARVCCEDGEVSSSGDNPWYEYGVRPALKLDLSKVTFDSSTKKFELTPVVEYPLWVGGVQVTSENKDDVLGDTDEGATVSYDVDTNTLTLNGVDIAAGYTEPGYNSSRGIYYSGNDSLSIVLSEDSDNKVGVTGNVQIGIESSRNITISGAGKLTVKGSGNYSVGIEAYALTIKDAEINVEGALNGIQTQKYGYGVNIISGKVNAIGQTGTGIHSGLRDVNYQTSAVTISENAMVVAIGGVKAINYLKNAIAGTGWTDPEDNTSKTTIPISSEGQSIDTLKKMAFPELPASTVTTAPEAKNLTYTGQAQELITAGEAEGGTMQYALGTDASTAPTTGWSTNIPTAISAGTYYVWYKVKGDKDHLDSEPACVEAAIAKRNVTLTSAEDSKDYDGKPLTNNNITVTGDGWAEGEGATYNVTGTQTLPGASDNGFTYTLNNNTKESNYNISKVINKLTVNDRTEKYEINVEVNSDNVTYDGNEHEVSGFKTLEFLCDDVTYTVSGLSASVIGTDAGTYDVVVTGTPLVKNSDDKDLTKQFIVNIVPGQLVIDTRNVSFTSASETKQYDGEPLTNDNVEITGDGFADGEGASFDVTGNQLVVGSSANTFTYTLNEGTNPDNYSITSQEGTLTVTNRLAKYEIIPKANSGEFTYDGSEHSVTGFVTDTFEVATDDETTHIYTLSGLTAEGIGTDVGEYTVNITGTPVVIDAEGNDVSSEFSVTPVAGNIVINKRNVTLTSASDSKAYDGKELTNEEVTVSGDGWAEGEGAEYKVTGTRKLPGETRNSFTYTLNEGTNADNYEITSVEGTLTITDRKAEDEEGSDKDVRYEITVVANSGNFTYDGTEHEVSGIESTEFIINDVIYTVSGIEASAKGTEVGTYPVKISGTPVVTDADGNDLTKQFTVNTKEGTLTVVEKSVNPEGDIRYSNYSGDRAVWTKGSNAGCEFVFKRSVDDELTFGHFTGIDVESKAVDASNYTAVSGSVVITLKPEYLETLAVGDHLLTANFDDGNSVTVKFTIKEKSEEKKSDTTLNNKKADVTPETGDTVNVQLIFLVMVLSMCVIFALCNLRSKFDEKKRRR